MPNSYFPDVVPPEYLHKVLYNTEGAADLTITFPYLLPEHIIVLRAAAGQTAGEEIWDVETRPSQWDFLDSSTVRLVTPIGAGEQIVILRQTRLDKRLVDYSNGSTLGEEDLNIVTKQLLYLIQEITEARVDGYGIGGGGDTGDNGLTDEEYDQLIADILATQLFQDLITLIPLMDINAELIIANQLQNHRDWLISGNFDYKIDTQGTRIDTVEYEIYDSEGALAGIETLLAARIDDSEAAILTLQTVQADHTSAIATNITEIQARVKSVDLDGLIDQSSLASYVDGVKVSADTNSADIESMTSYLVGVGGDFENIDGTSILGIMQTDISLHAGQISAHDIDLAQHTLDIAGIEVEIDPDGNGAVGSLSTWRQTLSSWFNADPANANSLAVAMQDKWQTYADVDSAVAARVTTLEADTAPIFFRDAANMPDPGDVEFSGTPWGTNGFPAGTMWYKIETPFQNLITPYYFSLTPYESGVGLPTIPLSVGYWIPATDNEAWVAGAKVQEVESVVVGPDGSAANMEARLQAVWGSSIASISEMLDVYVHPDDGIMYNSYNVRLNQNLGNGEVAIAGFGLGMQSDPLNPNAGARSDFIVIADYFSVIAPPPIGTLIDGVIDPSTIKVPFIIDSQSGEVVINGDLFVRGTLRAYEGGIKDLTVGRVQAGQMDSSIDLVDELGFRCGMYSSTNGYWYSNLASPFPGGKNPQEFVLWAGSGTMNHNNAVFYVDSDGNAFFGGEVLADNIDGALSSVHTISNYGSVKTANSAVNPVWLDNTLTFNNDTGRLREPVCMVNVSMYGQPGTDEGRAVMEMRYETAPSVWSSWYRVAESPIAIPTGTVLTLIGSLGGTVSLGVQVRVGLLQQNGDSPQSDGYQGMFLFIS